MDESQTIAYNKIIQGHIDTLREIRGSVAVSNGQLIEMIDRRIDDAKRQLLSVEKYD